MHDFRASDSHRINVAIQTRKGNFVALLVGKAILAVIVAIGYFLPIIIIGTGSFALFRIIPRTSQVARIAILVVAVRRFAPPGNIFRTGLVVRLFLSAFRLLLGCAVLLLIAVRPCAYGY